MADVTVASFHLIEVPPRGSIAGLARIGLDRPGLDHAEGLTFWRLLGTGRDGDVGPSFQPTRRALFAVWRDDAAIDEFFARHAVAARWSSAVEAWHVRLRLIDGHGRWARTDVLAGMDTVTVSSAPVVTLTRAAIAPRSVPAFVRASRSIGDDTHSVPGLRAVIGVGDVPIVRLGTLAVWDDDAAARSSATSWPAHAAAMRAAVEGRWFTESLFARFEPYGAVGTWSGTNPLA